MLGVGRYSIMATSGFTSFSYYYFYFYSDALLTICLYFVLMNLYAHVFSEMASASWCGGARCCFSRAPLGSLTAWSRCPAIGWLRTSLSNFPESVFVGVVLTYLLWGAMTKLRENRTHLMQLVLSTGVYFSMFAGSYALDNMYPNTVVWRYIFHLMAMWLPVSWTYTFWKVPEDARMATARVLVPNR